MPLTGRLKYVLLAMVWLGALGLGEWHLVRFELSPGSPAASVSDWPAASRLARTAGVFDLVLFVHPQCPCTRATIGELAVLMARCRERMAVRVLFVKPPRAADAWVNTDLWRMASALPGVTTVCDEAGSEAKCFGARTSGQVFLYDPSGRLRFQGGITASRGHAGDNTGSQAVCDIVLDGAPTAAATCVFGCPLEDPVADAGRSF